MLNARKESNLLFVEWGNRPPNLWKIELATITIDGSTTYTLAARTILILDVYYSYNNGTSSQTDRIMTPISRSDYASYANKSVSGPSTVYWFDRIITPTITLYPVPEASSADVIKYYFVSQIQDVALTGGQTPDLPNRMLDAYVAGLAKRLSVIYAPDRYPVLKQEYAEAWNLASSNDTENAPLRLRPRMSRYFR